MPTKSKIRSIQARDSVKVYFIGNDRALYKRLEVISKKHGMSVSKIAVLAIRLGITSVETGLEGLLVDLDSQEEAEIKRAGLLAPSAI